MEKGKIVGYCRVSTLEQKKKGYGIDIQIRDIKQYAEIFRLNVASFYVDEAKSGVSEDRNRLKQLIRDCKAGKVKAVIVASLDRLSRDLRFTENLFHDLGNLGVKVFIADMPHYDGNNRKDVLIRQIKEAIAEENRKEIIERLKKGREERVRKGKMAGGTLPYGYLRNSKEVKKNPKEVKIVKTIFALKKQNKSGLEIARYLNERGYCRRNGCSWTQRQVSAILSRRDLYQRGILRYGKISGEDKGLIIVD
jgi:DNA invertase Pin-like site-specific DNA recombinase